MGHHANYRGFDGYKNHVTPNIMLVLSLIYNGVNKKSKTASCILGYITEYNKVSQIMNCPKFWHFPLSQILTHVLEFKMLLSTKVSQIPNITSIVRKSTTVVVFVCA